jgi:hypothetical protein
MKILPQLNENISDFFGDFSQDDQKRINDYVNMTLEGLVFYLKDNDLLTWQQFDELRKKVLKNENNIEKSC